MTLRRSGAHPPRPSRGPTEAAPPKAPHGTRPGGALFLSLGGLLALAATLRFSGLAYRDLWFDELGSVALAATGSLWESEGGNPPLYFGLLRIWMSVTGTGIVPVRALSALFGVASVAALFWVALELRLPPAARWWGGILLACSPLHLYYSQEARPYALLVLLMLLAIASFLRAVRTGNRWWWVAHGASVVCGLYTHNMMIPIMGAFWPAAVILTPPRARWKALAVTQALAAVAYLPWLPRLWQQAGGDSHYWIAELMREASLIELVLGTVEAFDIGGRLPAHLEFPGDAPMASLAMLFFGIAGLMAVVGEYRAAPQTDERTLLKRTGVLILFAVWPILFLIGYSWLNKPLYVVGRYDLPGHAPYLLLIGVGIHALVVRLRNYGRAIALIPILVLLALTASALTPKIVLGNRHADQHASTRLAGLLQAHATSTDRVIALDISAPLATYAVMRSGLPLTTVPFPNERLHNLDEASLNRRVASRLPDFRQQAKALAGMVQQRRIWLVESPIYGDLAQPSHGYEVLKQLLMSELKHHQSPHVQRMATKLLTAVLLEPD